MQFHFPIKITWPKAAALTAACSLSIVLTLPTSVFAQTGADTAPAPVYVTSSAYQIVPEDVLDIAVIDHADINRVVPVMSDGTINYPYIGQINVVGMTIPDLTKRIAKDLGKQFVRPQVLITVSQRRLKTFSAAGTALKAPGKHTLKDGERLLEAISDAGGLPADRPEFFTATLFRDGKSIPIDLKALYANDAAANPVLYPDDLIYIIEKEAKETTVQVVGEVLKPGPVLFQRGGSVIAMLQQAGGPTPKALLSHVTIERNGIDTYINMVNYQKTGIDPSEKLEPGDTLIVPENKKEYFIYGPVPRAGANVYPDDRTLTIWSAIGYAGGALEGVELKQTKLLHPVVGADGKTTEMTTVIDVEHMWKTGDLSADKPVEPGDSIIIPPAGGRKGIQPLELIGILTSVLGLLVYFRR